MDMRYTYCNRFSIKILVNIDQCIILVSYDDQSLYFIFGLIYSCFFRLAMKLLDIYDDPDFKISENPIKVKKTIMDILEKTFSCMFK